MWLTGRHKIGNPGGDFREFKGRLNAVRGSGCCKTWTNPIAEFVAKSDLILFYTPNHARDLLQ